MLVLVYSSLWCETGRGCMYTRGRMRVGGLGCKAAWRGRRGLGHSLYGAKGDSAVRLELDGTGRADTGGDGGGRVRTANCEQSTRRGAWSECKVSGGSGLQRNYQQCPIAHNAEGIGTVYRYDTVLQCISTESTSSSAERSISEASHVSSKRVYRTVRELKRRPITTRRERSRGPPVQTVQTAPG